MHPVDHARSTARWLGLPSSQWQKFLPVHHWMDATKASYARIPHRALRHHEQGVQTMVRRMGDTFAGAPLREMMHRHLYEDTALGRIPTARDWLSAMTIPDWLPLPGSLMDARQFADGTASRWGGSPDSWLALHAWFLDPMDAQDFGDYRWLLMRHHAWGIFDCEEEFGPVHNGVPTRVIAEAHVRSVLGFIPPASDWLALIPMRPWMSPNPLVKASMFSAE